MSIEVGSKLAGKVTGITHFGAFVELPGGSTGLVHISEVADHYVKDIHEFVKVGDEVIVKVMSVEQDGKIGLSIRQAQDRPHLSDSSQRTRPHSSRGAKQASSSFEDKLTRFLKDSEERLSTLRRHVESKRGGRGARRG